MGLETRDWSVMAMVIILTIAVAYLWWKVTQDMTDNIIGTAELKDGAVTAAKIADGTITQYQMNIDYSLDDACRYFFENFQRVPKKYIGASSTNEYSLDVVPASGSAYALKEAILFDSYNLSFIVPTLQIDNSSSPTAATIASATVSVGTTPDTGTPTAGYSAGGVTLTTGTTAANTAGVCQASNFFGTDRPFSFVTSFSVTSVAAVNFKIGLGPVTVSSSAADSFIKLQAYTYSNDAAYFCFDAATSSYAEGIAGAFYDKTSGETFLHFVYNIGGTDYITQLPITVAVDTTYICEIRCDSDRKLSIFVNGLQYSLNSTVSGVIVSTVNAQVGVAGTGKSLALTTGTGFGAGARIVTEAAAAKTMYVNYFKGVSKSQIA